MAGRRLNGITVVARSHKYLATFVTQMKIKSITTILTLILFISFVSSAQELLPTSTTGYIVRHTYFTLSYSEKDEQPEWVYYELTPALIKGKQKRTDDYRPD